MALSAPALPGRSEVERRHVQWSRELKEMELAFAHEEREELAALDVAKHAIEVEYQKDREYLISQMPGGMVLPELFDNLLAEKKATALAKKQEEFAKQNTERKKRFEESKLEHLNKWRTSLFVAGPSPSRQPQLGPSPISANSSPTPETLIPAQTQAKETPGQHTPQQSSSVPSVEAGLARMEIDEEVQPPRVPNHIAPTPGKGKEHISPSQNPAAPISLPEPSPASRRTPLPDRSPGRGIPAPATSVPSLNFAPNIRPQPGPQTAAVSQAGRPSTVENIAPRQGPLGVSGPARNIVPPETQKSVNGRNPLPTGQPATSQHQKPTDNTSEGKAQKRKSIDSVESNPKRPRVEDEASTETALDKSPGHRRQRSQRTISFNEVYQGGKPLYKHIIVEYPAQSGEYYILRCDQHGVHFNLNPLAGAAKHLHSAQHGHMSKERAQAVDLLGYRVIDCTNELLEKNNDMVKKAFTEEGYKPFNLNQLSKSTRASLGYPPEPPSGPKPSTQRSDSQAPSTSNVNPPPPANIQSKRSFPGITHPVQGQLYLSYWAVERRDYVVLILPWGELEPAGLSGTLAATGLLSSTPRCYRLDPVTGEISGWANGYQDGGPNVHKREFPVFYFDGKSSVGWVPARDLSEVNFDTSTSKWRSIPYFLDAINHFAKTRGFDSFDEMRLMAAGRDIKTFRRSLLGQRPPQVPQVPDAPAPVLPSILPRNGDREMTNHQTYQIDDSDKDSVAITDSDNDVEMANTDSRRTSVSNRGELHGEYKEQNPVTNRTTSLASVLAAPRIEPPQTQQHGYEQSVSRPPAISLANQAQLIAAKALHLQGPAQDTRAPSRSPREAEFSGGISRDQGSQSRQSSVSSSDLGPVHRRVEKIYAHSNPNRTSKSPGAAAALSPEKAPSPVMVAPRVASSPASLQNILQKQPSHAQPRPGPLSQQTVLPDPQQARRPTPPVLLPVPVPGGPNQRALVPRMLGSNVPRLPSPLHILPSHGPVTTEQPSTRSDPNTPTVPSNSTSRSSTPVVLSGNEPSSVADRWRVIRSAPQPTPTPTASVEPRVVEAHQVRNPLTPSLSATNTSVPRSSSPQIVKTEYQPVKPQNAAKEYRVALLPESAGSPTGTDQPGRVFCLTVDHDNVVARSSTDAPEEFVLDPRVVKRVLVSPEGHTARRVQIVMEGDKQRTLIFDNADVGFGPQSGIVHTRRFCRWIMAASSGIDYQNLSSSTSVDPSRRTSQFATAQTVE